METLGGGQGRGDTAKMIPGGGQGGIYRYLVYVGFIVTLHKIYKCIRYEKRG